MTGHVSRMQDNLSGRWGARRVSIALAFDPSIGQRPWPKPFRTRVRNILPALADGIFMDATWVRDSARSVTLRGMCDRGREEAPSSWANAASFTYSLDVAARFLRGEGEDRDEGTREREREALGVRADAGDHVGKRQGLRVGAGDLRGVAVGLEKGEPGHETDGREHRRGQGGEHVGAVGHAGGARKEEEEAQGSARGARYLEE